MTVWMVEWGNVNLHPGGGVKERKGFDLFLLKPAAQLRKRQIEEAAKILDREESTYCQISTVDVVE